jgi:predicted nucleic-acid-binding protein
MIALDTNVIVRVVTRDDPQQVPAALAVMQSGDLWVSKTVLLETEWVLRYSYKLSPGMRFHVSVVKRAVNYLLGGADPA